MSKKPNPLEAVSNIFGTLNRTEPAPPSPAPPKPSAIPAKPKEEPALPRLGGRPATGKKSDKDYCQTSIYIRKATRKSVKQILLDSESEMDISDLVEMLLNKWLKTEI